MTTAKIQTRCECQAVLRAEINEAGRVVGGSADSFGSTQTAPATGVNVGEDRFQVGWLCPACGRNTSRSFFRGALVFS
jgi:hypothetical protein